MLDEVGLEDMAMGSAILGAGGGGDPYIGALIAREAIRTHGPVQVVDLSEVPDDATCCFCFLVGAPSVMVEKLPNARALAQAVTALEQHVGRTITHLVSIEMGGLNSVTPVGAAAQLGLPLVDADGMGRAFPSVAMVTPTLYGVPAAPMTMVDERGTIITIEEHDNGMVEHFARANVVAMGCSAGCAAYVMPGAVAKRALIPDTLALAQRLGVLVREARERREDPVAALLTDRDGVLLFSGKIMAVERRVEGGYTFGEVLIDGLDADDGRQMDLRFQNENLIAMVDGQVVASVPDLIMAVNVDTGEPIPAEGLRYGYRVAIVAMPCHEMWKTDEGLAVVGPRAFGYDMDHTPIGAP